MYKHKFKGQWHEIALQFELQSLSIQKVDKTEHNASGGSSFIA